MLNPSSHISEALSILQKIFETPQLISDVAIPFAIPNTNRPNLSAESEEIGSTDIKCLTLDSGKNDSHGLDLYVDIHAAWKDSRDVSYHEDKPQPQQMESLKLTIQGKKHDKTESEEMVLETQTMKNEGSLFTNLFVNSSNFDDPLDQKRLDIATIIVLLVNGGHEAALNIRGWNLKKQHSLAQPGDSFNDFFDRELIIIHRLLCLHKKAPALWIYRRTIFQLNPILSMSMIRREMDLIRDQALAKSHNYYAWSHWQWIVDPSGGNLLNRSFTNVGLTRYRIYATTIQEIDTNVAISFNEIISFLQDIIGRTPLHFAPYHHLLQALMFLCDQTELGGPTVNIDEVFQQCLIHSTKTISFYPDAESCWLFRTLLVELWIQNGQELRAKWILSELPRNNRFYTYENFVSRTDCFSIMPTENQINSVRIAIRQSIGQHYIPRARQHNNIWWYRLNVQQKAYPRLNVYPRLYPKCLSFRYFARFVHQLPQKRNLYECTHILPFRGVGCFLSRNDERAKDIPNELQFDENCDSTGKGKREDFSDESLVNSRDPNEDSLQSLNFQEGHEKSFSDSHATKRIKPWLKFASQSIMFHDNNMYFRPRRVQYRIRPFYGVMTGDLLQNGRLMKTNIQQHMRDKTGWNVQVPNLAPLCQYRPPIPSLLRDAYCRTIYPKDLVRFHLNEPLIQSDAEFWNFHLQNDK